MTSTTHPVLSERAFRDVMGRFATGVTVMTTTVDGELHGMTASAVASVSLEPLLVLVCVERTTAMCELVQRSGRFALSILHEDDEGLAVHFADPYRPDGTAQFDRVPWRPSGSGLPVLERAIAHVVCSVWATYDGGDHVVVVGEVTELGLAVVDDPLLFFRGAYRSLRPEGS